MADVVLLEPAQRELEEIARVHMRLVGPNSARNITDRIFDALQRLETFPLSGHALRDRELRRGGYRCVMAGKYLCFYRVAADTVYVCHIAHGASDYPSLLKQLMKEGSP